MSYDWTMVDYSFVLPKEHFSKAREDARLAARNPEGQRPQGQRPKSGKLDVPKEVMGPEVSDESFFQELFREYGFEIDLNAKTKDLDGLFQEGSSSCNSEELWEVLAPYVKSGSWINGHGEDDSYWQWRFKDGKVSDFSGVVVYDTNDNCPLKKYCEKGCPFSLICHGEGRCVLLKVMCARCGGELIMKDLANEVEPVAGITCKCQKRQFDVEKIDQT